MKLLIITQKVDRGDPILGFFHSWILKFAEQCEEIIVICLYEGQHELPKNVKVLSLGKPQYQSEARYGVRKMFLKLKYAVNFYRYILRERKNYNAVFVHMNQVYIILGGFIWKLLGKKISLWYMHKTISLSLRIAEKITDVIFSASQESFRLPSKKLIITGHGIDTDLFAPRPTVQGDAIILTSVGRISKIKRLDVIIDALALLSKGTMESITFHIVGSPITEADKKYEDKLHKKIESAKLSLKVFFVGSLPPLKIPAFLNQTSIALNLSATGSMDKAVLESMSCEVLTLSSNEAFKDVLSPSGLYIDSQDTISLTKIIEESVKKISDGELRKSLREYVLTNHSLKNLIPKLVNILTLNDTSK